VLNGQNPYTASTPRGWIWNRTCECDISWHQSSFNPTRVDLELGPVEPLVERSDSFNPTRVDLEPLRLSLPGGFAAASTPRGWIWNRRRGARRSPHRHASTPRGWIWNWAAANSAGLSIRLQPHEGGSGTWSPSPSSHRRTLQPHEGGSGTEAETYTDAIEQLLQPHEGGSGTQDMSHSQVRQKSCFNPTRVDLELSDSILNLRQT